MIALRIVYMANILVTAWISGYCLTSPEKAAWIIFQGAWPATEALRLVGALWGAICLLSIAGLFYPVSMSPILLFQVLYKFTWLVVAALPALVQGRPYPVGMTLFFVVWVMVLPLVIPWKALFMK